MIALIRDDLGSLAFMARHSLLPDRASWVGVLFVDGDKVLGAAGIDKQDITPDGTRINAYVHSCGRNYWHRGPLKRFFQWLFLELGFHRLTAECFTWNIRARAGMEWLGFREEGVRRQAGPEKQDIAILGMLRGECKLLGGT